MERVLARDVFGLLPAACIAQDDPARAGYLSSRYNEVAGLIKPVEIGPVSRQEPLHFVKPFYIVYNKNEQVKLIHFIREFDIFKK